MSAVALLVSRRVFVFVNIVFIFFSYEVVQERDISVSNSLHPNSRKFLLIGFLHVWPLEVIGVMCLEGLRSMKGILK